MQYQYKKSLSKTYQKIKYSKHTLDFLAFLAGFGDSDLNTFTPSPSAPPAVEGGPPSVRAVPGGAPVADSGRLSEESESKWVIHPLSDKN